MAKAKNDRLILVFLGPPGAGKGTYASRVKEIYGVHHIATGDIIREHIEEGTDFGKEAEDIVGRGELLPDAMIYELLDNYLKKHSIGKGLLLDGAPRTLTQAKMIDELLDKYDLSISNVFLLELAKEVIIKRLSNRRICPNCGEVYHLINMPPAEDEICDKCEADLIQREDDTEEVIEKRIQVYQERVAPIVDYYSSSDYFHRIPVEREVDEVVKDMKSIIDKINR